LLSFHFSKSCPTFFSANIHISGSPCRGNEMGCVGCIDEDNPTIEVRNGPWFGKVENFGFQFWCRHEPIVETFIYSQNTFGKRESLVEWETENELENLDTRRHQKPVLVSSSAIIDIHPKNWDISDSLTIDSVLVQEVDLFRRTYPEIRCGLNVSTSRSKTSRW
jgi:hypothetical protein